MSRGRRMKVRIGRGKRKLGKWGGEDWGDEIEESERRGEKKGEEEEEGKKERERRWRDGEKAYTKKSIPISLYKKEGKGKGIGWGRMGKTEWGETKGHERRRLVEDKK
jgi:hypothetical protein